MPATVSPGGFKNSLEKFALYQPLMAQVSSGSAGSPRERVFPDNGAGTAEIQRLKPYSSTKNCAFNGARGSRNLANSASGP